MVFNNIPHQTKRLFLSFMLVAFVTAAQAQKAVQITVSNQADLNREDELVVLKRSFLQTKLNQKLAQKFVTVKHNAQPILVQYDDLDKDGLWDEAVFLFSFKPKETALFSLAVSSQPATIKAVVRAHVRHKPKMADNSFGESLLVDEMPFNNQPTDFAKQKLPPYLTEGPAWENDKVGFRKYFDVRNANDIWGKTTNRMVMDQVGVNPDSVYHHLSWWGMDILKVGKSLGAGAIALKIPLANQKDTLLRMGSNTKQVTYKMLADGPVRAMFAITYLDCQVKKGIASVTVTENISIWGGQYFYNNEVSIKNAPKGTRLVTGIPDFYNCTMDSIKTKSATVLYSFGKQSENMDVLTMGVIVPTINLAQINKAGTENSDIKSAFLISQDIAAAKNASYRFYSLWQMSNKAFADRQKVELVLKQQATLMQSPLLVK